MCKRSKGIAISCPLSVSLATASLALYSSHPFSTPFIPVPGLQHAPGFKLQLRREPLRHTQFHSVRMRFFYMGSTRCHEPAGLQAHQLGSAARKEVAPQASLLLTGGKRSRQRRALGERDMVYWPEKVSTASAGCSTMSPAQLPRAWSWQWGTTPPLTG